MYLPFVGAQSDFKHATDVAAALVKVFGMSEKVSANKNTASS